ncbi:SHOCT domain-containing protein [Allomuricauda sp. NBRC 101325]|uniref:SHOCT domain-containing protein n=1 Tax=Allomuricauda sp. NBRC 101325 TaxID=1113758 RepID=UPI002553706B|nr:SHOCT domain-containing protein [Muricauda sp. NBRC 101325]
MHDWNWHNWGSVMMWLIWIPIIIIAAWYLLWLSNNKGFSEQGNESPLEVLKRRYANGEISTQEYERRKKILEEE